MTGVLINSFYNENNLAALGEPRKWISASKWTDSQQLGKIFSQSGTIAEFKGWTIFFYLLI